LLLGLKPIDLCVLSIRHINVTAKDIALIVKSTNIHCRSLQRTDKKANKNRPREDFKQKNNRYFGRNGKIHHQAKNELRHNINPT